MFAAYGVVVLVAVGCCVEVGSRLNSSSGVPVIAGVIGALPGVIGSMMALEAIKLIACAGTSLRGALLIYDGLHAEARRVRIAPRADCPVCHGAGGN